MSERMEISPRVAVIVLDWNGGPETLECLRALRVSQGVCLQVILVDNASREPVFETAREIIPDLVVLRNDSNLGYAGGNNVGLRHALGGDAEFFAVLNNDAAPRPDALRIMAHAARGDVGVVGARILCKEDPSRLWMAWGELTYRQSLVGLVGQGAADGPRWLGRREADWVSGCALLFPRQAIERVGFFDESYFAYHEEVDWCARARAQGLRVVWEPEAAVLHRGEASSGGGSYVSRKQYLAARNMVRFVGRHGSALQKVKFAFFVLSTTPFSFVRRWLRGEHRGVIAKLQGMLDAIRGRPLPRQRLGLDQ